MIAGLRLADRSVLVVDDAYNVMVNTERVVRVQLVKISTVIKTLSKSSCGISCYRSHQPNSTVKSDESLIVFPPTSSLSLQLNHVTCPGKPASFLSSTVTCSSIAVGSAVIFARRVDGQTVSDHSTRDCSVT